MKIKLKNEASLKSKASDKKPSKVLRSSTKEESHNFTGNLSVPRSTKLITAKPNNEGNNMGSNQKVDISSAGAIETSQIVGYCLDNKSDMSF